MLSSFFIPQTCTRNPAVNHPDFPDISGRNQTSQRKSNIYTDSFRSDKDDGISCFWRVRL